MVTTKEDNLKDLSCSLLNAGCLDVDFLLELSNTIDNQKFTIKGEETFLFSFDSEGKILSNAVDNLRDNQGEEAKIDVNALIYEVLNSVAQRVNEIYGLSLEEGEDYEIYTNCMDSHLSLKEEDNFKASDEENEISKEEQDEIKKIFEEFN